MFLILILLSIDSSLIGTLVAIKHIQTRIVYLIIYYALRPLRGRTCFKSFEIIDLCGWL